MLLGYPDEQLSLNVGCRSLSAARLSGLMLPEREVVYHLSSTELLIPKLAELLSVGLAKLAEY